MPKPRKQRLLLLDRSELAGNMLKLLLAQEAVTVSTIREIAELPAYLRKYPVDVLITNSNFLDPFLDVFLKTVQSSPQLQKLPKIFLCREDESSLQSHLKALSNSRITVRPFHPEAFKHLLSGVLQYA